jgi:hypothetical protein
MLGGCLYGVVKGLWRFNFAKATSARPADDAEPAWTYQGPGRRVGRGREDLEVAAVADLEPSRHQAHEVTGWLHRRDDPDFWDRVRDVCGLYLDPPERALVLSVDERPPPLVRTTVRTKRQEIR